VWSSLKTQEGERRTFEFWHLFPFFPVALRVDSGLRVANFPGRRETRGRRGSQ